MASAPRRIVLAVYPGVQSLDVVGPFEVFATAHKVLAHQGQPGAYELLIASLTKGPILTDSGLQLCSEAILGQLKKVDTLLMAGGDGAEAAARDESLLTSFKRATKRARRVGAVCTGTFILAQAGLLEGRRATTHWLRCKRLAARHPGVRVEPDRIYVRDEHIYTSAGVTAGIDLALALVEEDHGREIASMVAKLLVVFLRRPGGQSQFSAALTAQDKADANISELIAWMAANPHADLSVPALAKRVHMSGRHFSRVFTDQVGVTPARFASHVRLEAARQRLETGGAIETVATACGFKSAETMRRVFIRQLGVPPAVYRARFSAQPAHRRAPGSMR